MLTPLNERNAEWEALKALCSHWPMDDDCGLCGIRQVAMSTFVIGWLDDLIAAIDGPA
jgi:hypothetical protein